MFCEPSGLLDQDLELRPKPYRLQAQFEGSIPQASQAKPVTLRDGESHLKVHYHLRSPLEFGIPGRPLLRHTEASRGERGFAHTT